MIRFVVVAVGAAALAVWAVNSVSGAAESVYPFYAPLSAQQEVPKPVDVSASAQGNFEAAYNTARHRVVWKLTFAHLTGRVTEARVRLGGSGRVGPVLRWLCGPCTSGAHGAFILRAGQTKTQHWYVNLSTVKNQSGEIRGEVMLLPQTAAGGPGTTTAPFRPNPASICCPPG